MFIISIKSIDHQGYVLEMDMVFSKPLISQNFMFREYKSRKLRPFKIPELGEKITVGEFSP